MHMQIFTIAGNTFRESIRDKVLYNLILFAMIMIACSLLLGQLTLGNEAKVIVDVGLSSISIFGTLIAIFIGIGLVHKEIEKRTVYFLLAKPVERWHLVVGKYLGLLFTLLVNVSVMAAGLALALWYQGGVGGHTYARLVPAVYLLFLALSLTTALALLFSTFSTPALSAVFTFFLWVIGHFNRDLLEFGRWTKSAALQWLCTTLYYVLPNLSNFVWVDSRNVILTAAYGQPIDGFSVAWVSAYGLVYCSALLMLAAMIFSHRDFK
jgi:ABC-type transport system involved in multi-copper enzyme maturation permease subunit